MLVGFVMLRPWRCFACLGLFLSECFTTSSALQAVYVKTTDGTLRGFASTVLEKPIITFLGVPFATPPVADLRFRPPLPSKPWKGIRDATKPAPTCVQPLPEKCKFLIFGWKIAFFSRKGVVLKSSNFLTVKIKGKTLFYFTCPNC